METICRLNAVPKSACPHCLESALTPAHREMIAVARAALAEHGLAKQGWSFGFERASTRVGRCHFASRHIMISHEMVARAPLSVSREVFFHELAHALTPGEAHSALWQATARSVGASGFVNFAAYLDAEGVKRYDSSNY